MINQMSNKYVSLHKDEKCKDCMVLLKLWGTGAKMARPLSGLWRMEHDGRGENRE